MDSLQKPLVSDDDIKQLLTATALQNHAHKMCNQFAAAGDHPSDTIGAGLDFADRQPYTRGDDPRFIDWRASARSSQTLIRRYHAELSAPSCVVIDRRPSMLFGTKIRLKATQAIRLGIQCGAQLLKANQQLACLVLDEKEYWQAPSNSLARFSQTAHYSARAGVPFADNNAPHWARISDFLTQKLTHGSRLIIISDFISHPSHAKADGKALQWLSQRYNLTLLRISDHSEHYFDQRSIELTLNKSRHSIKSRDDLHSIKQQINTYQEQLNASLNALKCQHQLIFTHDDITHVRVA